MMLYGSSRLNTFIPLFNKQISGLSRCYYSAYTLEKYSLSNIKEVLYSTTKGSRSNDNNNASDMISLTTNVVGENHNNINNSNNNNNNYNNNNNNNQSLNGRLSPINKYSLANIREELHTNNNNFSSFPSPLNNTAATTTITTTNDNISKELDLVYRKMETNPIKYPSHYAIENRKPTICVGLSGGVDSAIVSYLLGKQDFKVKCVYIKSWDEKDELGYCSGERDYKDACDIAQSLGVTLFHRDFTKEYWNRVFHSFLKDYQQGYTPNPDVFCNREIKFDVFTEHAKQLGADMIATGHYATILHNQQQPQHQHQQQQQNNNIILKRGKDRNKDQSYFLCMTEGHKLAEAIFPLGEYLKNDVIAMANKIGFNNITSKRSSRGICFVGKRPLPEFLEQYIPLVRGAFVDDKGSIIGEHKGAVCYTIGQKANISGRQERYFIYKVDVINNQVHVCPESVSDQYLLSNACVISHLNWINGTPLALQSGLPIRAMCQIRYRADLTECLIEPINHNQQHSLQQQQQQQQQQSQQQQYRVTFVGKQERAATPGQIVCIYELESDICLGGGVVQHVETINGTILSPSKK
ncbi:tRNA (5-methylaminomethyl-2-thiouridylate)-methyltransferase [Cavenderia fasciculata]|uniref:tRNA-5-taurinomethyluridine 2-sulfurtransferase n=1 Tax=Cavenderia fasciculata TaxID=261658 RepID=F4QEF5_CACFS|nr:tRNA (5-methylaminomethyl-2-thiouridylate)-methyltransferase [Cavenderia fasciculata]EGG13268.1 tRNA (5-methylaminomethyl-2-thiouridylate)-methyltransferase [Cavenderia fasciculata]|eukprot:XP_004349967.1 tRNA (5-methylaminomethyl-2-thiouridylate)-methyltransferase [Cavenderia fasciculata]